MLRHVGISQMMFDARYRGYLYRQPTATLATDEHPLFYNFNAAFVRSNSGILEDFSKLTEKSSPKLLGNELTWLRVINALL
jgi:hypothetical protein